MQIYRSLYVLIFVFSLILGAAPVYALDKCSALFAVDNLSNSSEVAQYTPEELSFLDALKEMLSAESADLYVKSGAYLKRLDKSISSQELTDAEAAALFSYTANGFFVNAELYALSKGLATKDNPEFIKIYELFLNKALDKLPMFQGIVYRFSQSNLPIDFVEQLKIGAKVTFQPFTSTSKSAILRKNMYYEFVIQSKTGRILPFSYKPTEDEVLFKSKTTFKVLNIEIKKVPKRKDYHTTVFYLEEIPD